MAGGSEVSAVREALAQDEVVYNAAQRYRHVGVGEQGEVQAAYYDFLDAVLAHLEQQRAKDQGPEQRLLRAVAPRLAAMTEAELIVAIAKIQDVMAVVRR